MGRGCGTTRHPTVAVTWTRRPHLDPCPWVAPCMQTTPDRWPVGAKSSLDSQRKAQPLKDGLTLPHPAPSPDSRWPLCPCPLSCFDMCQRRPSPVGEGEEALLTHISTPSGH